MPKPAGILAFDDKVAERVLGACRWAGIPVPDQVGVLGVGNDELICELASPLLSSIALPAREIGRRAAEVLDDIVHGREQPPVRLPIQPFEVIARASTERIRAKHVAVIAAVMFIRTENHRPIGVAQIASAVGVSRRTLERRFTAEMNATVHDYLVETRLRRARRLLRQSGSPVSEIALACGYLAVSAFTRMFEVRTGESPEIYRQARRAQR